MTHRRTAIWLSCALALFAGQVPANAAPSNDQVANAVLITSLPFADERSLVGAGRENGEPEACYSEATVWYRLDLGMNANIQVSTRGSDFFSMIALYEEGGPFGLTFVACRYGWEKDPPSLTASVSAGRTYLIQTGSRYDLPGTLRLSVTRFGALAGQTSDTLDAAPAGEVCVSAWDAASRRKLGETTTDEDGDWRLQRIPATSVKLRFVDCGTDLSSGTPRARKLYRTTWYPNRASIRSAVPLAVPPDGLLDGLDVALPRLPMPDLAITDVRIEDVPLTIGGAGQGPATGTNRTVTVDAENHGVASPAWSTVVVDVCPRSSGSCKTIGRVALRLAPGETRSRSFPWNGADVIGDVRIIALIDADRDADWEDNVNETPHFVHVGGTGFGIGLCQGPAAGCGI